MSLVTVYTIAASLPEPGLYFILEKYIKEERCVWSSSAAAEYEHLLSQLLDGKGVPEGMSPLQATLKTLPYYINFQHPTGRLRRIVQLSDFAYDIIGDAGRADEPDGLNLVMISKSGGKPEWDPQFLMESAPKGILDPDNFEARTNRDFIRAVASATKPPATSDFKLVPVPATDEVRLTRNLRGEYVTQVPKVWS